jgi:hypothetical protein
MRLPTTQKTQTQIQILQQVVLLETQCMPMVGRDAQRLLNYDEAFLGRNTTG